MYCQCSLPCKYYTGIFFYLKLLKIKDLYKFNVLQYVYKTINIIGYDFSLLEYINDNSSNRHNLMTRYSSLITLPRYRCEKTKCSLRYFGCKSWNLLDSDIKFLSFHTFKCKLKCSLIDNYNQ